MISISQKYDNLCVATTHTKKIVIKVLEVFLALEEIGIIVIGYFSTHRISH